MTRLTAESWSCVSRIWKPCGSAGQLPVRAQEAVAQAVEGADPHAAHVDRQHARQPRQHLLRRLVGEGHRHHAAGRDLAGLDQPGDARRQHARLARAGAGQDQRRPRRQGHGGELLGVEVAQQAGDVGHRPFGVRAAIGGRLSASRGSRRRAGGRRLGGSCRSPPSVRTPGRPVARRRRLGSGASRDRAGPSGGDVRRSSLQSCRASPLLADACFSAGVAALRRCTIGLRAVAPRRRPPSPSAPPARRCRLAPDARPATGSRARAHRHVGGGGPAGQCRRRAGRRARARSPVGAAPPIGRPHGTIWRLGDRVSRVRRRRASRQLRDAPLDRASGLVDHRLAARPALRPAELRRRCRRRAPTARRGTGRSRGRCASSGARVRPAPRAPPKAASSAPAAATPRLIESCITTDSRLLPLLTRARRRGRPGVSVFMRGELHRVDERRTAPSSSRIASVRRGAVDQREAGDQAAEQQRVDDQHACGSRSA